AGRGVVQLSLYLDLFLANWLQPGAPGAIQFAMVLFNLPLGVFGMSVAAAELPELSRASRTEAGDRIAHRLEWALRQSALVICPAVVGYLVFGFLAVGLIYAGGRFTVEDNWLVYVVLCGYTLGLLASAVSRILQNTFFALRDTRTPAKIAAVRVAASALVGVGLMLWLDRFSVARTFGLEDAAKDLHLGALGLSLAAAAAAWAELILLRRALTGRVPELKLPIVPILKLLGLAGLTATPALVLWYLLPTSSVPLQALVVLPCYVFTYLGFAWWRRLPELELWLGRLRQSS
ncbi:MAG: murein biosynthesis integral membrane protein MurJ, partial [bacterium]|nr:murein biosynthesis integral membrane protein MurJ [bacterium]